MDEQGRGRVKTLADEIVLAIIIAAVGLASCLDCTAIPAEAQIPARLAAGGAPARDWGSDATILARALLAESDAHEADWRPILAVFQLRADRVGTTPAKLAVRYCRVYRATRPTPRIVELRAVPLVIAPARERMWSRALALARTWLAGDHAHGCSEAPSHFGDRHGDRARALRMRWREVTCPGSASGFWTERRLP